ncbi:MAG: hypothetical protein MJZ98_03720 [Paludibacteraceae bacterium]|nr:hypothetical protein [Paludibacteraceae bacterium]
MESTNENKTKLFSEKTAICISVIGFLIIIVSIFWFIGCGSWKFSSTIDEEKIGQFGDFIGGVVGSILAFAGVILYYVALNAQREDVKINRDALTTQIQALEHQIKEFKAQTEELQETRKVYEEQTTLYRVQTEFYKKQVDELSKQTAISKLEQFDSSFFSLLNVFVTTKEKNKEQISKTYQELIQKRQDSTFSFPKTLDYFMEVYGKYSNFLSQYLKTIYRILSIVDESSLSSSEKIRYAKILRSQLTDEELLILFYHYQSESSQKARSYVTQYELLKHLNPLEKIEYHVTDDSIRGQLTQFVKRLFNIINNNVNKYSDIEEGSDVKISEKEYLFNEELLYQLEIAERVFSYSISFIQDDKHEKMSSSISFVKNIVKTALFDILFISKYNSNFNEGIFTVSESTITEGESFSVKLTFTANIENILQ